MKEPIFFEFRQVVDDRGSFSALFKSNESITNAWGARTIKQVNLSKNRYKGTIRGLHFQKKPNAEAKIVICLKGSIYDCVINVEKESSLFLSKYEYKLDEDNNNCLFIPEGYAHGFQTLQDHTEVLYLHSNDWCPASESGLSYKDPKLAIDWPLEATIISDRDKNFLFIQ